MQPRTTMFITEAREHARRLWDSVNALKALQAEWNALDYGTTLPDGTGPNDGYSRAEVGAVVFDTADAVAAVFAQGHATNLANLL